MSEPLKVTELEKLFAEVTWGDQIRAEKAAGPKAGDTEKTARMLFAAATRLGVTADGETFDSFTDRIVLADMAGLKVAGMADPEDDAADPR